MKRVLTALMLAAACVASALADAEDASSLLADLPRAVVQVETAGGLHAFQVWIADTGWTKQRGLMFIKELRPDQGMLFLFEHPDFVSFWMKNTYLSLDIVFIAPDGTVANIAHETPPLSPAPIVSVAPVTAVLELLAGTAARIGLVAGDRIRYLPLPAQ